NAGNSVPLPVARRVQRVKPSPTLAVTARAARLREQGKDVISLGAGEPDFDTPAHIAQAGKDAIQGDFTRYTNVEGSDELKDAIIAKFGRDHALTYERSQILVSAGAKQILYNLAMAVVDSGDEVIIPAPYWVSYPDIVLLADGQPVMPFAGMAQGYKITPRQLAAAITPQTRLLLLNSPCNPTGAAYTHAELRGASITAMSTIQGQPTSNASSIAQKAPTTARNADQTCVTRMTAEFKQRRDYVVRALSSLPGVSCLPGAGTFYAFADVSRAISALACRDDGEFAELLLKEAGVAVVPGSGFGAPGHVRLSFACSMPTLEQALDR